MPITFDVSTRRNVNAPSKPVIETLSTVGGEQFTIFSKNAGGPTDDLYTNMISAYYAADIYCETWLFGA